MALATNGGATGSGAAGTRAPAPATIDSVEAQIAEWAAWARRGQLFSWWAERMGERTAIFSSHGDRSFAAVDANANRLAALLRDAGLEPGASVATVCGNVPEFVEAMLACQRSGFRFTPVNWHLAPDEVAYVLADCDARAWIVQGEHAGAVAGASPAQVPVRLVVRRAAPGMEEYAAAIARHSPAPPPEPQLGRTMLYTSGTTGQPKGVVKAGAAPVMPMRGVQPFDYRDGDVNLLCGPGYHGGPLAFDLLFPLSSGASIVLLERFDPTAVLAAIERYRVTHTHMVSTMFQRLLALPPAERSRFDVSSLRVLVHGAAPTPPEVKRAMIDWLGPVLWEYYAATEVATRINITSQEWLDRPGSVGRVPDDSGIRIVAEDGATCPPGIAGRICFPNAPGAPTRYHKAAEKNALVFGGAEFTVGDIGYVDEDGYLFLTGRSAETIIAGGVNIYPQEIDNVLLRHPAVRQSCTVGVPDPEWGEAVRGVVSLHEGVDWSPSLEAELIAFARERLARFKVPRRIDVVDEVPLSEAGKILRTAVRAGYWIGRERSI